MKTLLKFKNQDDPGDQQMVLVLSKKQKRERVNRIEKAFSNIKATNPYRSRKGRIARLIKQAMS